MKRSIWFGSTTLAITIVTSLFTTSSAYAQTVAPSTADPNTAAMDAYFSAVCTPALNLGVNRRATIQATTPLIQTALTNTCDAFFFGQRTPQSAVDFIKGINPIGFISFKIDSLLFARIENDTVMDHVQALRHDVNMSSAADNVNTMAKGGGASADESPLLGKKLGLWFRLNSSNGAKDQTALTSKLDSNQFGGNMGLDYRLTDNAVIGGMLGYRHSSAKFGDNGAAGNMDDNTFNLSAYFSSYLYKNLYLDSAINYGSNKFSTRRHVSDLSTPPALYSPDGSTRGNTLSGSAALGYEFAAGGWTITPSVQYQYIDSKIDAFAESGDGPFDLAYDKQHYTSSSARLGLNLSYAISSDNAVWLPHLRVEAIKEFGANIDTFDVSFINNLGVTPAPLTVQMDQLDDQYFRVSLGMSAQFHRDVSGYLDYQQLVGFDAVSLKSVVAGVRMQF